MNNILRQTILFTFCLLTSDFLLFAQAPQAIPYQAIARNASGNAIASTAVKVRFSIRDSIATGPVRYQETHTPTTSALGLFSVNVGAGTIVSGSFSGINWGKNAKFLQVELDPAGGNTYTNLGTTQMMSVPYAFYSEVAGSTSQNNSNYAPSADSVLSLTGVTKLSEGTYTVPNNEAWKIVSITEPTTSTLSSYKVYYVSCNSATSPPQCQMSRSDLFSLRIGSNQYSETVNQIFKQEAPTCSQCPEFIVRTFQKYDSSNYSSIQMPLWANGGEQIAVGPKFVIYIEKYR
jgi:hypothetical protein